MLCMINLNKEVAGGEEVTLYEQRQYLGNGDISRRHADVYLTHERVSGLSHDRHGLTRFSFAVVSSSPSAGKYLCLLGPCRECSGCWVPVRCDPLRRSDAGWDVVGSGISMTATEVRPVEPGRN